ncbi:indolepyruvate ferredoxin oxidoreductase family protein, partial [Cribrihabitans sp. XS_ASV171]
CSGCPHNSSTKLPEGSRANSGIGCHVMASWMNRDTDGYAQMGGEGVPHVVSSMFTGGKHVFQNLGEGTWYHSGSLAIRQAVAAGTNITYKILYNDAVAMTGGQPVDGPVSVSGIAQTCRAEGVKRIALVSEDISKFDKADFPSGTSFHDRADLMPLQRELREVEGVSVLIYEQTCATEKRRRRKRGTMEDPPKFAYINDLVCEGCGDCSVESNCLSVEPKETPFGRKRKINLSSCNKDFSCLNGFCPSFVTVEGATRRKREIKLDLAALEDGLPSPALPPLTAPFDLLVTGVGGTGVVTVGALITMAAHLEGKGSSVLDFTGFAQKFGTVLSYIRLSDRPEALNQVRIDQAAADAVIGCDMVVSSAPKASAHYRPGTKVVLNRAEMPTGDLVLRRDAQLKIDEREQEVSRVVGAEHVSGFDANAAAETLMGDAVFANVMMLGYAWQKGLVPVSHAALGQAVLLNGVAVEKNRLAFAVGRAMAEDPSRLDGYRDPQPEKETYDQLVARRAAFLAEYQDAAYAERYTERLEKFRADMPEASDEMLEAATKNLFKVMAYKDEFEVARLMTRRGFAEELAESFEGDFKVKYHMAPPVLNWKTDARGRPAKREFGPWMGKALRVMARMKGLRGTPFNPFGYHSEAREHRELTVLYMDILDNVPFCTNPDTALELLEAPAEIRGYGPVRAAAAEKVKARIKELMR